MIKTLKRAFQIREIRDRILFVFFILVVIRIGCQIPVPGVNTTYIASLLQAQTGDAFNFFDAITGGSLMNMSIFALNISPYITSSIVMQLLTIAIPKLEEMQKDGEDGRKKITMITRWLTIVLAIIEGSAMSIGLGAQGLLPVYTWYTVLVAVAAMTTGAGLLMWLGERITEKGVGNGISMVLLINIISGLPDDFVTLYERFIANADVAMKVLAIVIIVAVLFAMLAFTVLLQDGERRIPIQNSAKMSNRMMAAGRSYNKPLVLKVNTGGVIPVIFASSLMTTPGMIAQFFNVDYSTVGGKILLALNSSNWCRPDAPVYSIGLVIYCVLIVVFAYFYTSITFNPIEIADTMKRQGSFIPGIRPGKPTSDYLAKILNYIIFIGAVGLMIIALIPIFFSGIFNVSRLSFMGTSLIIIVGVILETLKQVETMMQQRSYKDVRTEGLFINY
ncbi:MAG: preprotein translocase subunit SecY [Lachnospiraceae bacterium]|nr:preprotein translocase subunit SecY [Lachnospiraceae bacterium]